MIDNLVMDLAKSDDQLYIHASRVSRRPRIIINPLGERLRHCVKVEFDRIHRLFPSSRLSPNVELFGRHLKESGLTWKVVDASTADAFNRLVEDIRSEAQKSPFVEDLRNYQRAKIGRASCRESVCQYV